MTTWLIQFDDNGEGLSTGDIAELEGLVTTLGFTATISSAPVPAPRLEWNFYPDNGQYWTTRAPWEIHVARDASTYGDGTKRIAPVKLEGSIYVGCESVDAAKSLAEKLNAVLSPPVGTQE